MNGTLPLVGAPRGVGAQSECAVQCSAQQGPSAACHTVAR